MIKLPKEEKKQFILEGVLLILSLSNLPAAAADFRVLPRNPLAEGCPLESVGGVGMNLWSVMHFYYRLGCPYRAVDVGEIENTNGERMIYEDLPDLYHEELFLDGLPVIFPSMPWTIEHHLTRIFVHNLITAPVIELSGAIGHGDAERLESLLRTQGLLQCYFEGYCPISPVLSLRSEGGSVEAALELARVIQRYQMTTYIPLDATCASSCAFVFAAGYTEYEGIFMPRRVLHGSSRLGLHRPSIDLSFGSYEIQHVQQILDLIESMVAEATRQFAAARVPQHFIASMYATRSENMFYLSAADTSLFASVIDSPWQVGARPSRQGILSYCASEYFRETGSFHSEILLSLDLREDTFLSFAGPSNFICYGAQTNDGWRVNTCFIMGEVTEYYSCALFFCILSAWYEPDYEFPEHEYIIQSQTEMLRPICGGADVRNGFGGFFEELQSTNVARAIEGTRLATYHHTIRLFMRDPLIQAEFSFPLLPSWTSSRIAPPQAYCGMADLRAPETARHLQAALNALGFAIGEPDGIIGQRTMDALRRARATRAPGIRMEDPAMLRALGVPELAVRAATLCQ